MPTNLAGKEPPSDKLESVGEAMRKASRVKPRLGSEGAHTFRVLRSTRGSAPVTMTTKADPRWTMAYVHQLPNTLGSRSTPFSHTHLLSIGGAIRTSFKPTIGHLPTPLGPARPTRCLGSKNEREPMPACPHFLSRCAQDPDQTLISKGQPLSFHTQILHSAASLTCGNFRNSNHSPTVQGWREA